jgi:cardiolipin synthase
MGLPAPSSYTALHIHPQGEQALASLMQMLEQAQTSLDICTFFLGRDVVGRQITNILIQQAQAGVRVRLLLDGLGMYLGGRPDLQPLKAAGVQVALFFPPFRVPFNGGTNLRNHRKLVIADQTRLWTGGRNLAAEYFSGDPDSTRQKGSWIDLSFDLAGPLVHDAQGLFEQDWALAYRGKRQAALPLASVYPEFHQTQPHQTEPQLPEPHPPEAQVIASGPDQADDTLYSLLISSCFSAQNRIFMVTPYFVPDANLLMALTLAARRGVRVDLLIPARSNHRLADMARHVSLRDMALAGAQVWLCPHMIHAKAVVVDEELALAGSANLDERSMFLNFEVMFAFFESADVTRFAQWLQHQRVDAVPYQAKKPGVLREFGEGLLRWLAFQL